MSNWLWNRLIICLITVVWLSEIITNSMYQKVVFIMTILNVLASISKIAGVLVTLTIVGVPSDPIRIGGSWYSITKVNAPASIKK